jgi:hypothetical protein
MRRIQTGTWPKHFSLRTLLLVILLLAAGLAWYGYTVRVIERERALLSGVWRMVDDDGTPVIIAGKEVRFDFTQQTVAIGMPHGDVGWIDFHNPQRPGTSRAIYRREGNRVRFAQADVDHPRPTEFDRAKCHTLWLAERVEDQTNNERGNRKGLTLMHN